MPFFAQSCPYEEGEDRCTATEYETGKRSQLKPLENHSFDNQAARAFSRNDELVRCCSACREGRWKRRVHMEEIDLTQHSDAKGCPDIARHPKRS